MATDRFVQNVGWLICINFIYHNLDISINFGSASLMIVGNWLPVCSDCLLYLGYVCASRENVEGDAEAV